MSNLHLELSDDARSFVDEQVATGRFADAGEFVANLIDQARQHAAHAQVEKLLLEGLDSGPGIEVTPDWWRQKAEDWQRKYVAGTTP